MRSGRTQLGEVEDGIMICKLSCLKNKSTQTSSLENRIASQIVSLDNYY